MRLSIFGVFALLVVMAVAMPLPAHADSIVVTGVYYSGSVYQTCCGEPYTAGTNPTGVTGSGTTPFDITTSSTVCVPGPCETSSITLSYLDGIASISGSGSSDAGAYNSGGGGTIYVDFYVAGPADDVVPLLFTGSGSSSVSDAEGSAIGEFSGFDGTFEACSSSENACGDFLSSFSGSAVYDVPTNYGEVLEVNLSAGLASSPGDWDASVEGSVEIDPSFESVSSTPEPSGLLLLGTGLLALPGFGGARKKMRSWFLRRPGRTI